MKFLNKYTLLLLCLMVGLYSCKKDSENKLHAVDMPYADTTSISPVYNVEQYDNLVVAPKLNYQGDTSNLSYQWLAYTKSVSSPAAGPPTILSEQRVLNKKLEIAPGNYYLEFIITDQSNGAKTTTRTLLNVLAIIENGWLVLHSNNNESDVDFIANSNLSPNTVAKRLKNLAFVQTGSKLKGEGQFIGYSRRSNSAFNWITVGTDQEIKRYNGFNFSLMDANAKLFRRQQSNFNFAAHLNTGSNEFLIDKNGLLQTLSWGAVEDATYGGVFNGDYKLAPYIVFSITYGSYGALVYDQKYQRFMYTTQTLTNLNFVQFNTSAVTTPEQAFDPSNVGKEMLFMDGGFNSYAYAFFKDNTGTGRYLYVLNQNEPDTGNLAVAAYDMTALPEIQNAKFFQIGDLGNIGYYATEKTVYKYDYSGSGTAVVAFNGIPVNESITCMKIYKPKRNSNGTPDLNVTNNKVLYVATWDGSQGKLYELAMNAANGEINPTPLNVYDGFGKIKDMIAKFRGTGL